MSQSVLIQAFPSAFEELAPQTAIVAGGPKTFHPFPRLVFELKMMVFSHAVKNMNLSPGVLDGLAHTYNFYIEGPSSWDRPNKHGFRSPLVSSATETRVWMDKVLHYKLENAGLYNLIGAGTFFRKALLEFWTKKLQACPDFFQYPPTGYENDFQMTVYTKDEVKDTVMNVLEEMIGFIKGERRDTCGPPPVKEVEWISVSDPVVEKW